MPYSPSALAALLCPHCGLDLAEVASPRGLACLSGHRFDAARSGYLNLLTGHPHGLRSDTAPMVAARQQFLDAGWYAPLRDQLAATAKRTMPAPREDSVVLEAGCGTGYYLAGLTAERAPVGIDLSPHALKRALHQVPGLTALVWDLWRPLPIAARSLDAVLAVFAPRPWAEFRRVLHPEGVLLMATPEPAHLEGLPQMAGRLGLHPDKGDSVLSAAQDYFTLTEQARVEYEIDLPVEAARQAVYMGPSGHHLTLEQITAELTEPSYRVSAAFRLWAFRPIR
ncbi:methyltransferase domain-containing protein [Psychromicrobium xiongbiense]|uniref:methyltransferase domain-containing protein n=1 Tax=Psychromicrobium xiongbiense TaxID=3051184 RepID=UPI0025559D7F|nr:methyltransferase domain-containing protein [Psychromicrobium sp. YIM S02556]